jgi:hypothetical protein
MNTDKFFLKFMLIITTGILLGFQDTVANSASKLSANCPGDNSQFSLEFFKTNNKGERYTKRYTKGINHVIIFNPKSPALDFKVNVGLAHKVYAKDARGNFQREYIPK